MRSRWNYISLSVWLTSRVTLIWTKKHDFSYDCLAKDLFLNHRLFEQLFNNNVLLFISFATLFTFWLTFAQNAPNFQTGLTGFVMWCSVKCCRRAVALVFPRELLIDNKSSTSWLVIHQAWRSREPHQGCECGGVMVFWNLRKDFAPNFTGYYVNFNPSHAPREFRKWGGVEQRRSQDFEWRKLRFAVRVNMRTGRTTWSLVVVVFAVIYGSNASLNLYISKDFANNELGKCKKFKSTQKS